MEKSEYFKQIKEQFMKELEIAVNKPYSEPDEKSIIMKFTLEEIKDYFDDDKNEQLKRWKDMKIINEDNETQIKQYMNQILSIQHEGVINPPVNKILDFFDIHPQNIKCVILGQDPYCKNYINKQTKEQIPYACGKSFVVDKKIPFDGIPPSLSTIFESLQKDLDFLINFSVSYNGKYNTKCILESPCVQCRDIQFFNEQLMYHVLQSESKDDFQYIIDEKSEEYKCLKTQIEKYEDMYEFRFKDIRQDIFDAILDQQYVFNIEEFKKQKKKKIGFMEKQQKDGVLFLNRVLTVGNVPKSHDSIGWQNLTQDILKNLSKQRKGIIYMLFGAEAKKNDQYIDKSSNVIIYKPHPSPINPKNKWSFIHKGPFLECYIRQQIFFHKKNMELGSETKDVPINWWIY